MVMKKTGLENNSEVLNLSFLTTPQLITGGKKNRNRNKNTKRNRKIKRKHNKFSKKRRQYYM
jgi:hypothetical protein